MDLDPDESLPWARVCDGAEILRERLQAMGLRPFLRTTGGKGLHLVMALTGGHDWPVVKGFAEALARAIAADAPGLFTAVSSKERRKGRIYLDYLRNARGASAVASYSLRARPDFPAATPIDWDELRKLSGGSAVQVVLIFVVKRLRSPWAAGPVVDGIVLAQCCKAYDQDASRCGDEDIRSVAMAGRASWKGYLKLSLVSCPVKLFPATSATAGKISFNLLHKDTLNRVQQKYHDPELGEIDRADLVKGYQFEKDKYVVVTGEELDEIEIESSKTIDIDGFVNAADIDPIYMDSTYYLAPDGPIAEETFAVILDAMKHEHKVAIARIVLSGRERMVTVQPIEDGFRLTTLRSAKEVREPSYALEKLNAKYSPDMLKMAEQIIENKPTKFAPEAFEDQYEEALLTLVKSKISGGQPIITKAPERGNVVNLMDALRRSIEEERRPPARSLGKAGEAAKAPAKSAKAAPAKKKASAA